MTFLRFIILFHFTHSDLIFHLSHLSDVAFMAESGMAPEVSPRGFTTLHSGSRMHVIGRGLMSM
jgi:hypothetical protein